MANQGLKTFFQTWFGFALCRWGLTLGWGWPEIAERRNKPPPHLSLSLSLIFLFLMLSISLSIFLPWSNAACTLYFMLFVTYFWEVILGKFNFSVQFFLPRFRIWGPYSTVPWFRAIFHHSAIPWFRVTPRLVTVYQVVGYNLRVHVRPLLR